MTFGSMDISGDFFSLCCGRQQLVDAYAACAAQGAKAQRSQVLIMPPQQRSGVPGAAILVSPGHGSIMCHHAYGVSSGAGSVETVGAAGVHAQCLGIHAMPCMYCHGCLCAR